MVLNRDSLHGTGNSGRLLEMLHGSDGYEKLISQLEQKEEASHRQAAEDEGQRKAQQEQPAGRNKRGRHAQEQRLGL